MGPRWRLVFEPGEGSSIWKERQLAVVEALLGEDACLQDHVAIRCWPSTKGSRNQGLCLRQTEVEKKGRRLY